MSYRIFDRMGRVIGQGYIGSDGEISLRDLALPCGLYFVSIGEKGSAVQKFVVID
ncbi:MAG: T9SS type A sorting domain-containing protein [Saprospiraceae bacterium]|nr:T9SS type A sorting domain-containing protein [Saprospiraceae bacterium]